MRNNSGNCLVSGLSVMRGPVCCSGGTSTQVLSSKSSKTSGKNALFKVLCKQKMVLVYEKHPVSDILTCVLC